MNVNQKRIIFYSGTVVSILVVAMFISIIPFTIADDNDTLPKASTNTAILRPDGDVAESLYGWNFNYYTRINDNVVQPNAGDGLYMTSSRTGAYTIHSTTDFDMPDEFFATEMTIWVRGKRTLSYSSHIPGVSYLIGMGASSPATLLPFGTSFEWRSVQYTGLLLSQEDVNDLLVKFTIETEGDGYPKIDTVYIVLTYGSPLPDSPRLNEITYDIINETVKIQLDWDDVICKSYNVYRSVNNGDYTFIEESLTSTNYSEILTETGIWLVSYRVSAVNEYGESSLSLPISINISPEGEPADYTMSYILLGVLLTLVLVGTITILSVKTKKRRKKSN